MQQPLTHKLNKLHHKNMNRVTLPIKIKLNINIQLCICVIIQMSSGHTEKKKFYFCGFIVTNQTPFPLGPSFTVAR